MLNGERGLLVTAKKHAQRAIYAKKSVREKAALDAVAFPDGVPENITDRTRKSGDRRLSQSRTGRLLRKLQ